MSYCAFVFSPHFRCRLGAHQAHPKRGHPSRRHHYREMQTGECVKPSVKLHLYCILSVQQI